MNGKIVDQYLSLNVRTLRPMISVYEIAVRAVADTAVHQIDIAMDYLDLQQNHVKALLDANSRRDLFSAQARSVGEFSDRFLAHVDGLVKIAEDAQRSMVDLVDEDDQKSSSVLDEQSDLPRVA